MIMISNNFISNFTNFYVIIFLCYSHLTQLFTLDILFSTAVVVVKSVILGISHLTSFILALRVVLVTKSVTSGVLSSIFFILTLYTSFSTASFST